MDTFAMGVTQFTVYRGPDTKYNSQEICYGYNKIALTIYDVADKAVAKVLSPTSYVGSSCTHKG
ncbi:hypothetical protein BJ878DRAFT_539867 [Calycina marina]|uniref:Uncharacterized protein n=1 Tax=Calycina marina TaxID=1763456 RepID=A0A9P7Z7S8_9HELO|nr:hypothetical protein BJ878DRAFT_539867 [Calycina marina]